MTDQESASKLAAVETRLEWLETRLAYHEQLVDSLNLVVTEQQSTIDTLTQKLRELLSEQGGQVRADAEKPPHY
jgi:uncharacterized coiled-coil protein SlyX